MSELRDRLERLAGRGSPRGADDVLRAAQRSGPTDVGFASAPDGDDHDLEIIDDVPFVTAEPARRRGRFATLIAATGVAVLAGVGVLAVTAMFGSGGADSPEGAVRQLADAVSHEDPLAAVDVLSPGEVRTLHETVQDISKRAADLKIIDRASAPLAGVDLSVDGLQLSTTDLADGYAKVTITGGTISAAAHREALSQLLQDATRDADQSNTSDTADLARLTGNDLPTFVITVRHDGRWYVSPIYTAFEYAREANDGPPAQFGSADASKLGADTPEHAIEDALRAAEAGDWNRLMALAPPSELPVYDYRAWISREVTADRPDFTIDSMTTTADVSGDHGVVKLEASGTFGSDGDRQTWQVGGSCATPGNYLRFGFSGSEAPDTTSGPDLCLAGDLGQAVPFGLFAAEQTTESAASGAVSVRVVKESGRWFVSPVGTVLDALDNFVEHVDEHTIYPLFGWGYLLPPDATLTLNQPAPVDEGGRLAYVYTFDGQKGQKVVGQSEGGRKGYDYYLSGELYLGSRNVGWIDFQPKGEDGYCCSYPETLPETGNYRLVVTGYVVEGTTLTLFDTDHAPKELLDNDGFDSSGSGEECSVKPNGTVECRSWSSASGGSASNGVATPTTVVGRPKDLTATTAP